MPGRYVVREANGQAVAYTYSRDDATEATEAKTLKTGTSGRRQHCETAGTAEEGGLRLTRLAPRGSPRDRAGRASTSTCVAPSTIEARPLFAYTYKSRRASVNNSSANTPPISSSPIR
jgi:hypothetical protein